MKHSTRTRGLHFQERDGHMALTPLGRCKRCSPGSWVGCSGPVPPFSLWKAGLAAQYPAGVPLPGLAAGLLPFPSLSAWKRLPRLLHPPVTQAFRASCGFHSKTVSRETKRLRPTYCGGIQTTGEQARAYAKLPKTAKWLQAKWPQISKAVIK